MIRNFVKDAVIYALPLFLAKAIGLLLLPIYTRQLGPTDFGFVEFVAAASVILLLALPLEINQAVARLLPESDSVDRQKIIISSTLWFTIGVFGVFGCVTYLFRFQLLDMVHLSGMYAQYAALVCLNFLVTAVINLLQVQFRFTSQAVPSVTINIAVVITNLVLVLYFAAAERLGIEQYFYSQIVSGLVGISVGLAMQTKKYGLLYGMIDMPILRQLLSYSLPIVLSSIGVALSSGVDKIMVGGYIGLTELGYYGAAARIAAIVGLGFYIISSAIAPIVYREYEKEETRILIARVFQFTLYGAIVLLLIVAIYGKLLTIFVVGERFSKGSEYIFYLMLSVVIANLYIFFMGMDIRKNTKMLSKINLSAGLMGTIGCIILVPVIGIWGAIISTFAANTARLVIYVYFSQRLYPIPINLRWPSILLAAVVLLNFIYMGIQSI